MCLFYFYCFSFNMNLIVPSTFFRVRKITSIRAYDIALCLTLHQTRMELNSGLKVKKQRGGIQRPADEFFVDFRGRVIKSRLVRDASAPLRFPINFPFAFFVSRLPGFFVAVFVRPLSFSLLLRIWFSGFLSETDAPQRFVLCFAYRLRKRMHNNKNSRTGCGKVMRQTVTLSET